MTDFPIREPDQIRQDCARKLRGVQVSDHFQAILGCLLGEAWTTPRLVEMVITPDGQTEVELTSYDAWRSAIEDGCGLSLARVDNAELRALFDRQLVAHRAFMEARHA